MPVLKRMMGTYKITDARRDGSSEGENLEVNLFVISVVDDFCLPRGHFFFFPAKNGLILFRKEVEIAY